MGIFTCNRYCLSLFLKKSSKQFLFSCYHKSIYVFWLQQRGSRAFQNFQNRVTRFYAPVARNERLPGVCMYACASVWHITRACMYYGRQSRARTKDPIRRYEHADPALWTYANQWQVVYEQALEKRTSGGTSRHQACPSVPVRHPPGNTCLALQEKRTDGDTAKMDFRSSWRASTWPSLRPYKNEEPVGQNRSALMTDEFNWRIMGPRFNYEQIVRRTYFCFKRAGFSNNIDDLCLNK